MLCSYLNMKQYETITATDGMEALNRLKMKPDINLSDINILLFQCRDLLLCCCHLFLDSFKPLGRCSVLW